MFDSLGINKIDDYLLFFIQLTDCINQLILSVTNLETKLARRAKDIIKNRQHVIGMQYVGTYVSFPCQ